MAHSMAHFAGSRLLSNVVQAIFAAVFWLYLGPAQFGGGASYILVSGNSMYPTLSLGDLVIARPPDQYRVGDIVMYRHPQLGMVIHRVIAIENGHYIFQGDHNPWRDNYYPVEADMVGKLWLHVPISGAWLKRMRESPVFIAVAVGLAATLGVVLFTHSDDSKKRRRKPGPRRTRESRQHSAGASSFSMNKTTSPSESLLFCMLIVGALAVGFSVIAFGQPLTQAGSDELTYEHRGTFGYTADAPPGIFDHGYVESGQPVFLKFTQSVTVTFDYLLTSTEVRDVGGSYRLVAEASDATGWKRTLELQPQTPFTSTHFAASSTLDLNQVRELIQRMEDLTGVHRPQYTLAIEAQVFALGRAGTYGWHEDFRPRLNLVLDDTQLRPVDAATLSTSQKGSVTQPTTVPHLMSLLMFKVPVMTARLIALVLFAVSLVGVVVILLLRSRVKMQPETSIQNRYGGQLVATARVNRWPGVVVDVAEIDDLMKLAERENAVVLHAADDTGHHYFLPVGDTVYHYQLSGMNSCEVPQPA